MSKIKTVFDAFGRELFDYEKPIVEAFMKKYEQESLQLTRREEALVPALKRISELGEDIYAQTLARKALEELGL